MSTTPEPKRIVRVITITVDQHGKAQTSETTPTGGIYGGDARPLQRVAAHLCGPGREDAQRVAAHALAFSADTEDEILDAARFCGETAVALARKNGWLAEDDNHEEPA